jgi:uncharacterized protein with von Willebrand factor type A (vWA) domain
MFLDFFLLLKRHGLPVSLREHLMLLEALKEGQAAGSVEHFYHLAKSALVKNEQFLDKFDRLFGQYFQGMDQVPMDLPREIPEDWLRKNLEKFLSEEEKAMIEAMGGLEKLMERFKELQEEQEERHEGGNRWIGTGGTSPFGAYGYNPEGFRIGQEGSRHRKAVKVWDRRNYRNLDGDAELQTRNLLVALRKLRVLTREGLPDTLDLDKTLKKTSDNAGLLEIQMVASKRNRVKVLIFFDIGGSMDDHIQMCESLFSAAKHEFKHLVYYYFHNCPYEMLWQDNQRRYSESMSTMELLNTFNPDYRVIFVGDASMSPYELVSVGGSVEHFNDEPGAVWMKRLLSRFPRAVWLNPIPEPYWKYTQSIGMVRQLMEERMYPLTLDGISAAIKKLKNSGKTG